MPRIGCVELDREAIERRDFPTSRRGYDPASVDAHLRSVAGRLEELTRAHAGSASTLASAAGTQVQSILATAETAAADIAREANADAARTREEAIAASKAHVAAVADAASALLARVDALGEALSASVGEAQATAARLQRDLAALETQIGDLYDAAGAGREAGVARASEHLDFPIPTEVPGSRAPVETEAPRATGRIAASPLAATAPTASAPVARATGPAAPSADTESTTAPGAPVAMAEVDADGARLVALNMALSGEPREETDRYLAENFTLSDRAQLIEEVYAAVDA
jgi:DivIVA domain-containing protein